MANRRSGLILASALAAASFFLLWLGVHSSPLRLLLGLPLVLFLPGYTIQAAAFENPRLGGPERFVLSVGLSISVVILTGLGLNATPWKLDTRIWALLLALITWIAALAAAWKIYKSNGLTRSFLSLKNISTGVGRQISQFSRVGNRLLSFVGKRSASSRAQDADLTNGSLATLPSRTIARRAGLRPLEVVLLGLALIFAVFAVGVTRLPAPSGNLEGYTLFWILPAGGGNADSVRLGVESMETKPEQYRVEVYAGNQLVQDWSAIRLDPQQKWEQALDVPITAYGKLPVTAWLYRLDQPGSIYRKVVLRR